MVQYSSLLILLLMAVSIHGQLGYYGPYPGLPPIGLPPPPPPPPPVVAPGVGYGISESQKFI